MSGGVAPSDHLRKQDIVAKLEIGRPRTATQRIERKPLLHRVTHQHDVETAKALLQPPRAPERPAAGEHRRLAPPSRGVDQALDIGLLRQIAGLGLDPVAVQGKAGVKAPNAAGRVQDDLELLEIGLAAARMPKAAIVGGLGADRLGRHTGQLLVPRLVVGPNIRRGAKAMPDVRAGAPPTAMNEDSAARQLLGPSPGETTIHRLLFSCISRERFSFATSQHLDRRRKKKARRRWRASVLKDL